MEARIFHGLSVGVVQRGTVFHKGYGRQADEKSNLLDSKSLFEIGSITKVFSGMLLAKAVVDGKLQLDSKINEFLPSDMMVKYFKPRGEDAEAIPISLKNISTHVSGLPRLPTNLRPANPKNPYADYDIERMKEFLQEYRVRRAPETKSEYSNFAVGLLGWVLSEKAGTDYESLLKAEILSPLKMTNTFIEIPGTELARFATGHTVDDDPTSPWEMNVLAGAGGIRSCTEDLVKFMQAQLEPPTDQLGEAFELAWKVHQKPIDKSDFAMGLGWLIARDGNTHFHNGGTGGFHSSMFVDRRSQTGVVVLANTASGEVDLLAESLIQKLFGMKVPPRVFEKSLRVDPIVMQSFVGRYELVPKIFFDVRVDGEKLFVRLTGQDEFRVYPKSDRVWKYKVVDAELTFEVDERKQCTGLDLFQNGVHQRAKRVEETR
jgi:CubicO group peptidase (beta-lactamase class C family)